MKAVFFILTIFSLGASAKEIKDFNQRLMEDVRKDVRSDNDLDLKEKKSPVMRGPASVAPEWEAAAEDSKLEKVRELGPKRW